MMPGFFRPMQLEPGDAVPILVNCTPHPIRFQDRDGQVAEIPPSGYTLKATPAERFAWEQFGCELVRTTFMPSEEGERELREIEARPNLMPVGSIISAQAWPGRVFALVPVEGHERKPPAERLYRCDKFTVF